MPAGGGVLVMSEGHELGSDESLLRDQLEFAGVAEQLGGDQDGHVIDVLSPVTGDLLSVQVGVDRHLGDAASTDGIDEVDGSPASLGPDGFQRSF
jgi:hypothetical protein